MQTSRVGGSYLQDDNRRPPRNMKNQKPPFENNIPKKGFSHAQLYITVRGNNDKQAYNRFFPGILEVTRTRMAHLPLLLVYLRIRNRKFIVFLRLPRDDWNAGENEPARNFLLYCRVYKRRIRKRFSVALSLPIAKQDLSCSVPTLAYHIAQ